MFSSFGSEKLKIKVPTEKWAKFFYVMARAILLLYTLNVALVFLSPRLESPDWHNMTGQIMIGFAPMLFIVLGLLGISRFSIKEAKVRLNISMQMSGILWISSILYWLLVALQAAAIVLVFRGPATSTSMNPGFLTFLSLRNIIGALIILLSLRSVGNVLRQQS